MTNRRACFLLSAFLVFVFVSSPQSNASPQPCDLPCWYGLQVGSSTVEDTIAVLRALPFVDHRVQPTTTGGEAGGTQTLQWVCLEQKRGVCGNATFEAGRLASLWTSAGFDLTLRLAVEELGPPQFAGYTPRPTGGGCTINLYWPDQGIIAGASVAKSCPSPGSRAGGMKVSPVFQVDSLYLGSACDPLFQRGALALEHDWQGFRTGPGLLFDYLPGDAAAWWVGLAGITLLAALAPALPRLPAALVGFPLAFAVTYLPMRQFLQLDNPGLELLARGNILFLTGLLFTLLVMGIRRIKHPR